MLHNPNNLPLLLQGHVKNVCAGRIFRSNSLESYHQQKQNYLVVPPNSELNVLINLSMTSHMNLLPWDRYPIPPSPRGHKLQMYSGLSTTATAVPKFDNLRI